MLFIGLMIHDVSEGVMLGLQTSYTHVIYLSIALILHKWCESCCQVMTGIKKGVQKRNNILTSVGLSLGSPVSQLIAFAIMYATNKNSVSNSFFIVQNIFMSFAAGTFLTIILVEIVAEEIQGKTKQQTLKLLLSMVGGFLFIAACSSLEYLI